MRYSKYILIFCLAALAVLTEAIAADRCGEVMILDGSEIVLKYGMDTTQHWWAITQPFTGMARITIDGEASEAFNEVTEPVFSPDGNRWACFVRDNHSWYVMTEDSVIFLDCNLPGELVYSGNSQVLAYSCFTGTVENITLGETHFAVSNRTGNLFVNWDGTGYAIVGSRGDKKVININGRESTIHDDIIPLGFWHTGEMVYIAADGNLSEIMKNEKAFSEKYPAITEAAINLFGTCLGAAVRVSSDKMSSLLISDDYTEPLIGAQYDAVSAIRLHPSLPLIAYNAVQNLQNLVVLNTSEYFGGKNGSSARFSYDGSEMYFIGCDIDCFISINGKKYSVMSGLNLGANYAYCPQKKAIAYATSSSLMVRDIERNELFSGMMVDEVIQPRYNRRTGRFETIGRISDRLYFMVCEF